MALQAVSVRTAAYRLSLCVSPDIRRVVIEGLAPGLAAHMASVAARPSNIKKLDVDSAETLVSLVDDSALLDSIESCDKRVGVVSAILNRRRFLGLVPSPDRPSYRGYGYCDSEATKVALRKGSKTSGSYRTPITLEAISKVRHPDPEIVAQWMGTLSQDDLAPVLSWFCSSRIRHVEAVASAVADLCLRSAPEVLERALHSGNSAGELCLQVTSKLSRETPVQAFYLLSKTRRVQNTSILEQIKPLLANGTVGFSPEFLAKLDASSDLGLKLLCDRVDPLSAKEIADRLEYDYPGDLRFDVMRLVSNPELIDRLLAEATDRGWFSNHVSNVLRPSAVPTPYRIGPLLHVPGISKESVKLLLEVAETSSAVKFLTSKTSETERWMFDIITSRVSSSTIFWSANDLGLERVCKDSLRTLAESLVLNSEDLVHTFSSGMGIQTKSRPVYEAIAEVVSDRLGEDLDRWSIFGGFLESLKDCKMSVILDATEAISG